MSALNEFDVAALRYLRAINRPLKDHDGRLLTYSLRHLTAASLSNVIIPSLSDALDCLPGLIYLDFTDTCAVNDINILEQIGSEARFPNLEILKLRNIYLDSIGLKYVTKGLGTRVWSLDVRGNWLDDVAVEFLINDCFLPRQHVSPLSYHQEQMDHMTGAGPADDMVGVIRRLASGPSSQGPRRHQSGITHLYICDNRVSVRGANLLLGMWRLIALDFGELRMPCEDPDGPGERSRNICAVEIFTAHLCQELGAGMRMRYLRIDSRLVYGDADLLDEDPNRALGACWPSGWFQFRHGELVYYSELLSLGFYTLALTDVPSKSRYGWIPRTFRAFLASCSDTESSLGGDAAYMLRELCLEIPRPRSCWADQILQAYDQECTGGAHEGDFTVPPEVEFSFFPTWTSDERDNGASTQERAPNRVATPIPEEEDPFEGDMVKVLQAYREHDPWKWTGKLTVSRPPRFLDEPTPPHDTDPFVVI